MESVEVLAAVSLVDDDASPSSTGRHCGCFLLERVAVEDAAAAALAVEVAATSAVAAPTRPFLEAPPRRGCLAMVATKVRMVGVCACVQAARVQTEHDPRIPLIDESYIA